MKKLTCFIAYLILLNSHSILIHAQSFQWMKDSEPQQEVEGPIAIDTDANGDVFYLGRRPGSLNTYEVIKRKGYDGTFSWGRLIIDLELPQNLIMRDLAVGPDNHVYVLGRVKEEGKVDLNSDNIADVEGTGPAFVAKLNGANGTLMWVTQTETSYNGDYDNDASALAINTSGEVYMISMFGSGLDTDGDGIFDILGMGSYWTTYIAKLNDSTGTIEKINTWISWPYNALPNSAYYDLAIHNNTLFVQGLDSYTIDFDGDGTVDSNFYRYLVSLDASTLSVNWLQTVHADNDVNIVLSRIETDYFGNVYLAGWFKGYLHLNEDTVFDLFQPDGTYFVARYDGLSGDLEWEKPILYVGDTPLTASFLNLAVKGDVYVSGDYEQDLTFENGFVLPNGAGEDVMLASMDRRTGNFEWAKAGRGIADHISTGLAASTSGGIFVAGEYRGNDIDFDEDGITETTTEEPVDHFVAKFQDSFCDVDWEGPLEQSAGNIFISTVCDFATIEFFDQYNSEIGEVFSMNPDLFPDGEEESAEGAFEREDHPEACDTQSESCTRFTYTENEDPLNYLLFEIKLQDPDEPYAAFNVRITDRQENEFELGTIELSFGESGNIASHSLKKNVLSPHSERTDKPELSFYPNPANPSTNIVLQLPEQSPVKLAVYDMLGRKIEDLVDRTLDAGTHTIRWHGAHFPNGVYLFRISTNKTIISKKMTLLH